MIRLVQGEELLDTAFPLGEYAFGATPPVRERAELARWLPDPAESSVLVLFEDGRPMATATAIHMTQQVRGAVLPMGAVASVATHPLGRRKGYARQVLAELLRHMSDAGQPVSTLHPFRETFYGRLGYVSFPTRRIVQFSPDSLGALLRQEIAGDLDWLPIKEGYNAFRAFMEAVQPSIHGLALRPPINAARRRDDNRHWLVRATIDGQTAGVLTYRITGHTEELRVADFFYTSSQAKYLLLQWLARHIDQVKHIWLTVKPGDQIETWLDDHDFKLHSDYSLHGYYDPMGRVVTVAGLTGLATGPGRFTARVHDEYGPWNNGAYAFATVDGRLEVSAASAADCDLSIRGLSALVYGGYAPADFALRGWGNPPPAVQAAMLSVFPPHHLPYLHEGF
jgi:predicted acetyltransferase